MSKKLLRFVVLSSIAGVASTSYAMQDLTAALPNAQPGECYAKVVLPPKYRTESSTVVVKEASEQVKIVPARYEWTEQRVLVSEAGSELRAIPATFSTVTETYEASPASTRWVMGSKGSNIDANEGMLALARSHGANINDAVPGQCFDEHFKPATYKTITERVLVSEASEKVQLNPAQYEWVEQRVMVAPSSRKLVEVPAVFESVQERIKVEDAKSVWKKGRGSIEKIDHTTGDIMCLVEVPAVYKTLSKRVVKSPASTRVIEQPARYETIKVRKLVKDAAETRVAIPAKYETITRRVLDQSATHTWHNSAGNGSKYGRHTGNKICLQGTPAKTASFTKQVVKTPASVQRVEIPAKYETKKVQQLVEDAKEVRTQIPQQTQSISKRIKVSDARLEWRSILCDTNVTPGIIQKVQRALLSAGQAPGPIDGVLGSQTMAAVDKYQRANGLATGGLTFDTLKKLGVSTHH